MIMTKKDAALAYAKMGWYVTPLTPGGKAPLRGSHGYQDATTNPAKIERWWTENPQYNVGIVHGAQSGITVIDIDKQNGGVESFEEWQKIHGVGKPGFMAYTPSGGYHMFFAYHPEVKNKRSDIKGVDVLNGSLERGGHVCVWPSVVDGRLYEWDANFNPIEATSELRELPGRWILELSKDKRKESAPGKSHADISGRKFGEGERNDGLASIAGTLRAFGISQEALEAALQEENALRCNPPLHPQEVRQIARSIGKMAVRHDYVENYHIQKEGERIARERIHPDFWEWVAEQEKEQRDYYFETGTELMLSPKHVDWVVRNWVPRGVTMLFGGAGTGKSFLSVDMACSIATGREWHGHKTKPGHVFYLCGEGNYGMSKRVYSWAKENNVFRIDKLHVSSGPIGLDQPGGKGVKKVIKAMLECLPEGAPVSMVVIDTLNTHMSGDENKAQESAAFIEACAAIQKAFNTSILLVHHQGKAKDSKEARGSSVWRASMDSQILLESDKDKNITIECVKMKDDEAPVGILGRLKTVYTGLSDDENNEIKGAVFEYVGLHIENKTVELAKESGEIQNAKLAKAITALTKCIASGAISDGRISLFTFVDYCHEIGENDMARWAERLPSWRGDLQLLNDNGMIDYDGKTHEIVIKDSMILAYKGVENMQNQ